MPIRKRGWPALLLGPLLCPILGLVLAPGVWANDIPLVLRGATLIDGRGGPPVENSLVVIQGDRITAAGAAGTITPPEPATAIDLRGKFLLPGFIDAHAHFTLDKVAAELVDGLPQLSIAYDPETTRGLLSNLLADGITTIRNPGGSAAIAVALRADVRSGKLPGPDIVTAGELLSAVPFAGLTTPVSTTREIAAEIERQAGLGVDLVKIYFDIPEDQFAFAVETAHRFNLPAIAHTGNLSWTRAAQLGIDGLVHIMPISPDLLSGAPRDTFLATRRPGAFEFFEWYEAVDLQSGAIAEMAAELARRRVIVDPTLVMFEAGFWGDNEAITRNPEFNRLPPHLVDNWRNFFNLNLGWVDNDFSRAHAAWPKVLQMTRILFEAGVPLAVGTDLGNPWIVPGQSFHREMALLAEAGIPPLAILTMATRNGARVSGQDSTTGTVEAGKLANLVVLDADPIADIANTRSISTLVHRGVLHDPAAFKVTYVSGD